MMLHEAVMLEIYRQALNASELASPRCHSRESNTSAMATDIRCPSNDSHCSGNENLTPAATPIPTTPPVGLPMQATLAPAAAATLLPPQSAMAAYLNAAAAAAQQNHLLLTNPLAAAASFVQQATQGHSPTEDMKRTLNSSPCMTEAPALDFSTKQSQRDSEDSSNVDEDEAKEVAKRRRNSEENDADETDENDNAAADDANAPLDLSVNTGRKRQSDDVEVPLSKTPRLCDYKPFQQTAWVPPINPYLAAVAAASLSPKTDCWANKSKYMPNEALEKMTEMTRLGAATTATTNEHARGTTQSSAATNTTTTTTSSSNGRHSAWQSHWLTKGADAVKDVFKCVWCKQSFPTLASLTVHMKETQHCGVNVPAAVAAGAVNSNASSAAISATSHHAARHSNREANGANGGGAGSGSNTGHSTLASNATGSNTSSKSDLNLLIKETMPLPRKLVRGQDVWLGKGAEQTRQILKCMWCGQSFRSLAEMTNHMQETQHYTNIISQEQIISWKSSDEKGGSGTNGSSSSAGNAAREASINAAGTCAPVNTAISAVLTCKVCDQAFPTLKELSNHMVKNSHYKEHMIRAAPPSVEHSVSSSSSPTAGGGRGRGGRQGRGEKRKKSLPVRKLLEMERAQHDYKGSNNSLDSALKPLRDFAASTKITCEKCGDKIETVLFVDHIRQCLGGHIPMSPRHNNNNNNNNNNSLKGSYTEASSREQTPHSNQSLDGRKTADIEMTSSLTGSSRSEILCPLPKEGEKLTSSTPSVLNAIEQLIEKSFETRIRTGSSSYGATGAGSKPNTPLGSSILKRLGIDDSADYTKPMMDAQTMNFLRSYSNYSAPRDRSASESSSVSERCSSRFDSSVTPERSNELSRQATPRLLTPEKPLALKVESTTEHEMPKIKNDPDAEEFSTPAEESKPMQKISVKKEFNMPEENEQQLIHSNTSNAASPTPSERSATPKSPTSHREEKLPTVGSSLNALSSMFDNLNNRVATSSSSNLLTAPETNNNQTGGKKPTANPLAALQKLCETTSETSSTKNSRSNSNALPSSNGAGAGNMVAFSWACNDGVMTSPDATIKCSYCDTPFSSKGAYRHHLSKVHFIKDDAGGEGNRLKSPNLITSPKTISATSPKRCNSKSPINQRQSVSPAASAIVTPTINPYDESPQSKFLKYTELAKQLSSKNA